MHDVRDGCSALLLSGDTIGVEAAVQVHHNSVGGYVGDNRVKEPHAPTLRHSAVHVRLPSR